MVFFPRNTSLPLTFFHIMFSLSVLTISIILCVGLCEASMTPGCFMCNIELIRPKSHTLQLHASIKAVTAAIPASGLGCAIDLMHCYGSQSCSHNTSPTVCVCVCVCVLCMAAAAAEPID